ncbi:MAG: hypothetical protein ACD_52C00088G0003 [uncultured bacterium]|uniref:Leucine--tRNA ligase n=1 Tax=Candidatus Woesebacteria bacterium RIFCSPHIGHO2_12_FULL_41_24 TaxID=1802510 RepID=A0A1F8AST5_9BACT|nr:MAG: hypothetical protein ACD_52C00088G0003 [uncultured bacterium]OGM15003.1 MAG: hypothetical protein A2W15_04190 [Candidatus Woesebacteria bacterium RBG_16_41_13]OGM30002.1 MAG: hypothetical protein A2873_04740 [Candidatus Woesebacteria bacterium RIFCSPHIGHO2_01_FULL_42_80]OGM35080.1 MAG: hypothetical protein A3D84_01905 [Candidatus Woesebacteria bacterium RIFCSPHIGHO2_02_FULL_42_20]OGM54816.1 MAG: hypothetical protein A3E44_01505 [Candidatus Woesebacteria bacterium RIFCSPHIGHO2_12_FULL_41
MEKKRTYNNKQVEKKWQERWLKGKIYSPNLSVPDKKFYNLYMFPYPSAEGLHAGHAFSSTGSDVYGRFQRMVGWNVFQPIGYDSFGIHSENYAIKVGETPQTMLKRTTNHYERQFKSLGHGYDWTRTVTTSDVDYYRWTQWLFVEMFKSDLAYRKKVEVNFCPSCKTVLADEQVMTPAQAMKEPKNFDGSPVAEPDNARICERCGTVVEKRDLEQWLFRITDYADRLLANLAKIDWPAKIKLAQKNWIGRKEGIEIKYPILNSQFSIAVWTSRPDTNFGATFIVISPEHPDALKLTNSDHRKEIEDYIKVSKNISKYQRIAEGREKTGAFTGSYAVNQLNGYKMPIFIADFVLMDVGTGAVVGVPGHDIRDFQFARKFKIEIKRVVIGTDGDESEIAEEAQVQEEEGKMVNSEFLNGLDIHRATVKMMDYLEDRGWGKRTTSYHLRDWLISRQRYWGPPIPMIYCEFCAKREISYFTKHKPLITNHHDDWSSFGWFPEENLPVELPVIQDYKPEGTGRGPLANHPEFYRTKCPHCGGEARRETDVSDTFLDSSWYFLRYPSVGLDVSHSESSDLRTSWPDRSLSSALQRHQTQITNHQSLPWSQEVTRNWLPVDLYFGGAEHSVLHLMYARFVTMVLKDLGYLSFEEPFPTFYAHGLLIKDGAKMSKSRGNVINPDHYIEKFGADALRLYLMFLGPMDAKSDFRDSGIEGMRKFLNRLWETFVNLPRTKHESVEVLSKLHKTVKKLTKDISEFKYNTSIAAIMELVNSIRNAGRVSGATLNVLALLVAPFAPHLAEEVWVEVLNKKYSVHKATWPSYDEKYLSTDSVLVAVQVNGKLRGQVAVKLDKAADESYVVALAKSDQKISNWLAKGKIKKQIYVPSKILNFVI